MITASYLDELRLERDKREKKAEEKEKKVEKQEPKKTGFFKGVKAEFKKIVWSSRRDTFRNTVLVIVSIIVVAVCIGALDYVFSTLLSALGKLI